MTLAATSVAEIRHCFTEPPSVIIKNLMTKDSPKLKKSFKELKAHIEQSNINAAIEVISTVIREYPLELAEFIRENQLLARGRSAEERKILKEAYIKQVLSSIGGGEFIRTEIAHAFYSELISAERDAIAQEARAAANALGTLGFETGAELCCGAIAALTQKHLNTINATHNTQGKSPYLNERLSDLFHEIGGIQQLLPIMLKELAVSCGTNTESQPVRPIAAARAVRDLLGLAEDWQFLLDLRQRIAFGFTKVLRIAPGPKIILAPTDADRACHNLISRQRVSLHGLQSRRIEGGEEFFGPLTRTIAQVAINTVGTVPNACTPERLAAELMKYIASHIRGVDVLLLTTLPEGEQNDRLRCLWCGYLLVVAMHLVSGFIRKGFLRKRQDYIMMLEAADFADIVARLASASSEASAREVVALLTANPASQQPIDLSTQPLLRVNEQCIGVTMMPTMPDGFMETRRILATGNHTSRLLGKAYEHYIGSILQDAGITTVDFGVKLKEDGRTVTDVDILGLKDDIVFVIQAKFMAEPGSHHERWKGLEHIEKGVQQCLLARDYFARHPDKLKSKLPSLQASGKYELCFLVVSPSFHFSHTGTWPVSVIDDQYLDHIARVKQSFKFEIDTGNIVDPQPLYPGDHPTGQELRSLIMAPAYQESLNFGTNALVETESKLGAITVSEYKAMSVFESSSPT